MSTTGPSSVAIEQLIAQRVAEAMEAYEANQNNQNRNGNPGVNVGGVVGLTRWFEKIESVFRINNCLQKYQVKYASCTLQDSALTWWNSHKRTIGTDAAYAMTWKALMKLMTEVYCLINKIHKMETELWNLSVKGNDLTAYTQRFQELILLCTKMVPEEEERVEKFIRGLPDNIQGNVIAAKPTRLHDTIRISNNLMDQKLKGYAARNADNKRRFDNNPRDNCEQQPPFKRHNMARAYIVGYNKNKGYAGILPLCDACTLYHHGPCPVKCGNYKKVGHQARDCWTPTSVTCYECGGKGHTKRYRPKLGNVNGDGEARQNLDIVMGTSLPENLLHFHLN
ncbi:putative reverse transcriptase domain-containing protein [Tanacetum coccineum]